MQTVQSAAGLLYFIFEDLSVSPGRPPGGIQSQPSKKAATLWRSSLRRSSIRRLGDFLGYAAGTDPSQAGPRAVSRSEFRRFKEVTKLKHMKATVLVVISSLLPSAAYAGATLEEICSVAANRVSAKVLHPACDTPGNAECTAALEKSEDLFNATKRKCIKHNGAGILPPSPDELCTLFAGRGVADDMGEVARIKPPEFPSEDDLRTLESRAKSRDAADKKFAEITKMQDDITKKEAALKQGCMGAIRNGY